MKPDGIRLIIKLGQEAVIHKEYLTTELSLQIFKNICATSKMLKNGD